MQYQFNVGPNATDLGFFWIFAHYFGKPLIALVFIAIVVLAAWLIYRKLNAKYKDMLDVYKNLKK